MPPPITLCGSLSRQAVPLGAVMHNAGYRALDLSWTYVPFEIDDVAAAVAAIRTLGLRGAGVSVPFKRAIMPLLDDIDETARALGAVNTMVNDGGRLCGHNTDWVGAVHAVQELRPVAGERVLVLGAGGAARAIAYGMRRHGAEVTLCNRTAQRAAEVAGELGVAQLSWDERGHTEAFGVVINASSAGMAGHSLDSPLPEGCLRAEQLVMDAVYKPLHTELLAQAQRSGATTLDGSRMLLHQAAAQFALYTERDAPLDAMDAALRAHIGAAAS